MEQESQSNAERLLQLLQKPKQAAHSPESKIQSDAHDVQSGDKAPGPVHYPQALLHAAHKLVEKS